MVIHVHIYSTIRKYLHQEGEGHAHNNTTSNLFSKSSTDPGSVLLVKNRNSTNPDYAFDPIGYRKEADTNISLALGLGIDLALCSRK